MFIIWLSFGIRVYKAVTAILFFVYYQVIVGLMMNGDKVVCPIVMRVRGIK